MIDNKLPSDAALEHVKVKEVVLEKLMCSVTRTIPFCVMANSQLKAREIPRTIEGMILDLSTYVASDDLDKAEYEVSYPATWWQHFKKEVFPRRLVKRWPVVWKKHKIKYNLKATYPDFNHAFPLGERRLKLLRYEGDVKTSTRPSKKEVVKVQFEQCKTDIDRQAVFMLYVMDRDFPRDDILDAMEELGIDDHFSIGEKK